MSYFRYNTDPIGSDPNGHLHKAEIPAQAEKPAEAGEDTAYFAVLYTENHPDKDRTFLGVFSTEEKAKEAIARHMAAEKARLPRAYISDMDYDIFEGLVDLGR